jgi:hypothetical protein
MGAGADVASGMRVMSRSEMLAERRRAALAPLDSISLENAPAVLRDTAGRLRRLYEADVANPRFGDGMDPGDVAMFKDAVAQLWAEVASITSEDMQGVSDEEGAALIAFVKHVARVTDDLSDSGTCRAGVRMVVVVVAVVGCLLIGDDGGTQHDVSAQRYAMRL